jgi:DNA-binding response OmpR family regulator/HPt (histidine-containing phosphotransfer) domain-containing protein
VRILLIEDDEHFSELISATLSTHHYAVDMVADGAMGLDMAARWSYDLILLDILLPVLNGIEVCRRLRAQGCQTPILMLTMKDSNEDIITGLDAGSDDYVTKSCDLSQLLARVRALMRRGSNASSSPILKWGMLQLDPALAQVTYNQVGITLRPKEYNLLELFLRYPQRILSRSAIIDHLWPFEETPVEGSVTNLIKDLRQRLKAAGVDADFIETVYGLGYRLKTAPTEEAKTVTGETASTSILGATQSDNWQLQQRGVAAIQQITERFWKSLEHRIATLETAAQLLQASNFSVQQRKSARTEAHKLAGGLGTFGYGEASQTAQAIERLLEGEVSQGTRLADQFAQLVKKLKQELAQPVTK